MWFNYLLSWHVVVMKDGALNINRAKLTPQMGFGRGDSCRNPPAQEATEEKNRRNALLPLPGSICFFILNSHLMNSMRLGEK